MIKHVVVAILFACSTLATAAFSTPSRSTSWTTFCIMGRGGAAVVMPGDGAPAGVCSVSCPGDGSSCSISPADCPRGGGATSCSCLSDSFKGTKAVCRCAYEQ